MLMGMDALTFTVSSKITSQLRLVFTVAKLGSTTFLFQNLLMHLVNLATTIATTTKTKSTPAIN